MVLALLLTVLAWPVSAFVRRHYQVGYQLNGRDARAHRVIRITSLVVLATFLGAIGLMAVMLSDFDQLSAGNDWLVHALRVLALVVLPLGAAIAAWNAWAVLRSGRRKWAKFWAIVLALSCLVILWAGVAFRLVGVSANY